MRVIRRNVFTPIVYFAIFSALVLGWFYFHYLKRAISPENVISFFGYVSFATTLLRWLWDHWLWHLPLLRKLSKVPNLSGRWAGSYRRLGGESDNRQHGYVLEIRQMFSSIRCSTYQDNGTSSAGILSEVCDFADGPTAAVRGIL